MFGLISRDNQFYYQTSGKKMTADFIVEQLDKFSFAINKPTVVVLDNARIHTAHKVKQRLQAWQARGLYLFYLPPYCPHLNICERVWKELKARWLKPEDYLSADDLFYALSLALAAVGKNLFINFSELSLQFNLFVSRYLFSFKLFVFQVQLSPLLEQSKRHQCMDDKR